MRIHAENRVLFGWTIESKYEFKAEPDSNENSYKVGDPIYWVGNSLNFLPTNWVPCISFLPTSNSITHRTTADELRDRSSALVAHRSDSRQRVVQVQGPCHSYPQPQLILPSDLITNTIYYYSTILDNLNYIYNVPEIGNQGRRSRDNRKTK